VDEERETETEIRMKIESSTLIYMTGMWVGEWTGGEHCRIEMELRKRVCERGGGLG